jgi:hypothetical protein
VTPQQHAAQRDMVVRSLLLAATPEERSEERRFNRKAIPAQVEAPAVIARAYRLPVVSERLL